MERKEWWLFMLGANNLKGTIPTILGQLSELRALDLKWNEGLHGSIPEEPLQPHQIRVAQPKDDQYHWSALSKHR